MQAISRLMDRLERYFKTDIRRLLSGGFWLLAMRAAQIVLVLGSSLAFANWLPKDVYGEYRFVLSVYTLIAIATLPGINSAVQRAAAEGVGGALITGLRKQMLFALIGSVISVGIAAYYFLMGNALLGICFAIIALVMPFFDTLDLFTNYLEGKLRFKEEMWARTIMQAVSVACLVLATYLTSNLVWILIAYFVPYILVRLIMHRRIVDRDGLKEDEASRASVTFGYHLSAMEVLNQLASNTDRLLIWHYFGPAALAGYAIAAAPVIEYRSVLTSVTSLILPRFVQMKVAQVKQSVYSRLLYYFIIVLGSTAAYIALAPFMFHLLFPLYPESVRYTQYFALVVLFLPKNIMSTVFLAHTKLKESYITGILGNGSRIIAGIILIPLFGIPGAIIAFLFSQTIDATTTVLLFERMRPEEPAV